MTQFRSDFKIEDRGTGLRAVFNVKNAPDSTPPQALDEATLVGRIKMVEAGGRSASLEKTALYQLQRALQTPRR